MNLEKKEIENISWKMSSELTVRILVVHGLPHMAVVEATAKNLG